MSRGIKETNDYAKLFPNYDKIPKSVFAGVCASLLAIKNNEDFENIESYFLMEWETLYINQIIPQKPIMIVDKNLS